MPSSKALAPALADLSRRYLLESKRALTSAPLYLPSFGRSGGGLSSRSRRRYPVVLLARSAATYEPLAKEIEQSGGKAVGISMDVTSPESVRSAFDKVKALGDGSPVTCAAAVMNGAGAFARKSFLELTHEEFENGSLKAAYALPAQPLHLS